MKCFPLYLIVLLFSVFTHAESLHNWQLSDQSLILQTDQQHVRLTALTPDAIEVLYDASAPQLPSFAIDKAGLPKNVAVQVVENNEQLHFKTKHIAAIVTKSPLTIRFEYQNRYLITDLTGLMSTPAEQAPTPTPNKPVQLNFKLQPQEQVMGGGERVLGMDRRGYRLPLYNQAHYGYGTYSEQMNFSIPAIISDRKYTLLFDNTAKGWMDIGKSTSNIMTFEALGGRKSYVILGGLNHPQLLHHYVNVTGKQPLPPRWAFGNHASRFGYRTQAEVLETIALYRELKVPVDSVILDLYWFGKDVKGHMGNLDWDYESFPQPQNMISKLQADGVQTVLITEPFVLTTSKRWQEAVASKALAKELNGNRPKVFDFFFGNTGLVDVFSADGRDWFGGIYQNLAEQGVTGVWGDLGEPEVHPADMLHLLDGTGLANTLSTVTADDIHNAYGHQWAKLVYDALKNLQPETRQFMIMRSGFAGSQRFGMIPWTGDVSRSWDGLKPQVELSLQMGLLGLAYTHSDLGGFAGGKNFDQEMYIRWLQYGVFQPIYRPHAQDSIAPEPVFHDDLTLSIVRRYINLRYRLLPYNYTLAYENSTTGAPLMRPMFWYDETDPNLILVKDQYFWGADLLVKPVTEAGINSVPVMLPKGHWFDFWTGKPFVGGQTIDYPVDLQTIPVLVRAGAIIPTVDLVQTTRDYSSQRLSLDYYFHPEVKTSQAQVYDDDGQSSTTLKHKQYELLKFSAVHSKNDAQQAQLTFKLSHEKTALSSGENPPRTVKLTIHNWTASTLKMVIDGKTLSQDDYLYDPISKRLQIHAITWRGEPTLTIYF